MQLSPITILIIEIDNNKLKNLFISDFKKKEKETRKLN